MNTIFKLTVVVAGVTAVGDMTVTVGKSVGETTVGAVNDTTKWVREQSESFGTELGTTHTMLPDQTVSEIATEHNVKVRHATLLVLEQGERVHLITKSTNLYASLWFRTKDSAEPRWHRQPL